MDKQYTANIHSKKDEQGKQCLNCGTQLKGEYCHNCGQHVTDHTMTVKDFILNYLDNAFLWDSKHIKTLWLLISRPGYLTNEYISGKFVSQVQPLKLNMFLLIVFLTLFVFFASDKSINNSIHQLANEDVMISALQMEAINDDEVYIEKIESSPRDTIDLIAPLYIAEEYPNIIKAHQVMYAQDKNKLGQWTAIVPHVLIEDSIITAGKDGYYRFENLSNTIKEELFLFEAVGEQILSITMQYFPIIMLLTAPLLAFSLRIVIRKKKRPYFEHFIFSMHYTAFAELFIIIIYLIYLFFRPPMEIINIAFAISSCIYFAISFRNVYDTTWFRSITKAIFSNMIYYTICLLIFTIVFFIACFIVAINIEL